MAVARKVKFFYQDGDRVSTEEEWLSIKTPKDQAIFERKMEKYQKALANSVYAKEYLDKRGIPLELVLEQGGGLIADVSVTHTAVDGYFFQKMPALIFALRDFEGKPSGAKWRNIPTPTATTTADGRIMRADGLDFPRFDSFGTNYLWNKDALKTANEIWICEGVLDHFALLALGKAAVTLGSADWPLVYEAIEALKPEQQITFILCGDRDMLDKNKHAGGANEKVKAGGEELDTGEAAEASLRASLRGFKQHRVLKQGFFNQCEDQAFLDFCLEHNLKDVNALWTFDRQRFEQRVAELDALIAKNDPADFETFAPFDIVEHKKNLKKSTANANNGANNKETPAGDAPKPRKLNFIRGVDALKRLAEEIKFNQENPPIPTPWPELNKRLSGGWHGGEIYTLGGLTGIGKTAFAAFIAESIASPPPDSGRKPHPVLYVCVEETERQILARMIAKKTALDDFELYGLSKRRVLAAQGAEIERVNRAVERLGKTFFENIDFITGGEEDDPYRFGVDIDLLPDNLHGYAANGQRPFLILDYAQILTSTRAQVFNDKRAQIEAVLGQIKRIANEFKVPILLLSSVSRAAYNAPLGLESIKESGGFEFTSDMVLVIQYSGAEDAAAKRQSVTVKGDMRDNKVAYDLSVEEKGFGYLELKCLKARSDPFKDALKLAFYPQTGHFEFAGIVKPELTATGALRRAAEDVDITGDRQPPTEQGKPANDETSKMFVNDPPW